MTDSEVAGSVDMEEHLFEVAGSRPFGQFRCKVAKMELGNDALNQFFNFCCAQVRTLKRMKKTLKEDALGIEVRSGHEIMKSAPIIPTRSRLFATFCRLLCCGRQQIGLH